MNLKNKIMRGGFTSHTGAPNAILSKWLQSGALTYSSSGLHFYVVSSDIS